MHILIAITYINIQQLFHIKMTKKKIVGKETLTGEMILF